MKEIKGNLWDYYGKSGYEICVTTNGIVNAKGENIMGRGSALEAKKRFPNLPKMIGEILDTFGNHFWRLPTHPGLAIFPTKVRWWEKSNLTLIEQSAKELRYIAEITSTIFILPRPGCGNGGRDWETEIKPIMKNLPDNVWVITP